MDYKNKSLIGFAGAPWTLLLYMIHKQSPKKDFNKNKILNDKNLLNKLIVKLEDIICLHIDKQIEAGANVIQLFDSWAGLLSKDDLNKYCYSPTVKIVNHIKGDFLNYSWKNKKFDVVVSWLALYHIKDHNKLLKNCFKLIKEKKLK